MKKALLLFWLLTKRLYKKPTFLAILVLIPLLTLAYSTVATRDSGVVVIALAGDADPLTQQIFDDLCNDGQLLRYTKCENALQAQTLVATGKADGAWIFPQNLESALDAFVKDAAKGGFVHVLQREETVALMLARERLSGALYPYIARGYYLRFLRENYPELETMSDTQLLQYYEATELTDNLFTYGDVGEQTQQLHYLMSPIRGLLAVVTVLGTMATAMYTLQDRQWGTFQWLPAKYQLLPELVTQWITALHLSAVSLLTLTVAGVGTDFVSELAAMLLYSLCTAAFGMLLRRLLGSIRRIGTVIPLLTVAMLLICPVFFDLGGLRSLQLLLPPTYYINGAYNVRYLGYGICYSIICMLLCLGLDAVHGGQMPAKKGYHLFEK